MTAPTKESVRAAVKAAEVELARVRTARAEADPEASNQAVARATEALEQARIAGWVFDATGDVHGLVLRDDLVLGSIALVIPPGTGQEARAELVDDAAVGLLTERAAEVGAIVAAQPSRYTRERPGRDAEGRTVLDVRARLEGDKLVPAVSKASRRR